MTRRVGLVPAAGLGSRMGFPFSKELYPVGYGAGVGPRPVTALELLLGHLRAGGATTAYVVVRDGKWDIPRHLATDGVPGIDLAYLVARESPGVPFSLDTATPFLDDAVVLMGFPDILVEPADAYRPVVARLEGGDADVAVGLFAPVDPDVNDQVRMDGDRVVEVAPKPVRDPLDYAWALAAWRPTFTRFLHHRTRALRRRGRDRGEDGVEYSVGHVFADALTEGLTIEGVQVEGGSFLDIGTPEGLGQALADGRVDPRPGAGGAGA